MAVNGSEDEEADSGAGMAKSKSGKAMLEGVIWDVWKADGRRGDERAQHRLSHQAYRVPFRAQEEPRWLR